MVWNEVMVWKYKKRFLITVILLLIGRTALIGNEIQIAFPTYTAAEKERVKLSNPKESFSVGDKISTGTDEKLTVMFINGSVVRLMPQTIFEIQRFREYNPKKREFESKFKLNQGAAVFLTSANTLRGVIETPNIFISNLAQSLIAVSINNGFTSVSVTKGQPIIENRLYQKQVYPGQNILDIGYTQEFTEDIKLSEEYILTRSDTDYLLKKTDRQLNLGFSGQLINKNTNKNVHKSFQVFLYTNIFSGPLAEDNFLNRRGFTYQDVKISAVRDMLDDQSEIFFSFIPDDPQFIMITGEPKNLKVSNQETEISETEKRNE